MRALSKLLRHDEEVAYARRRTGKRVPELRSSAEFKGASGILSTLKHSSGKTFGTNEERADMKRRVYAYYHTFAPTPHDHGLTEGR